jgi:hypothetical protein
MTSSVLSNECDHLADTYRRIESRMHRQPPHEPIASHPLLLEMALTQGSQGLCFEKVYARDRR